MDLGETLDHPRCELQVKEQAVGLPIGERLIATEQRRRQERCAGRQIERVSVPLEDTHVGIKALEERMRCTNAVLRDWGRIGLMLANDGRWAGKTVVPQEWLLESTPRVLSSLPEDGSAPKRSWSRRTTPDSPNLLYGYHVWLQSGPDRPFSLRGLRGQFVFVDPGSKLVLVQTAAREVRFQDEELFALWAALRSQ